MALGVNPYLRRISYEGEINIDHNTLAALQVQHMLSVPFENLDIHLGNEILLDLARLENKIVKHRRGGFCYELNGLFCALLRHLGFRVKMVSARVANEGGGFGQEFDHMALVVDLGEEWLVDVGFGECSLTPIPLTVGAEHNDSTGTYLIQPHQGEYLRLDAARNNDDFTPQYLFTLTERQLGDYASMCAYHQTSPKSSFTHRRVCSQATQTGRITLTDKEFIETVDGHKTVTALMGENDFREILHERFGIEIS